MQSKKTYDDYIRELGLYVATPINLYVLFDTQEVAILSCLRHYDNLHEPFISFSMLKLMTGIDEKTIRRCLKRLTEMSFIEKGKTCKDGTHYKIKYRRLYEAVKELNEERNPYFRLEIANKYRGEEMRRNLKLIEGYNLFINS